MAYNLGTALPPVCAIAPVRRAGTGPGPGCARYPGTASWLPGLCQASWNVRFRAAFAAW